MTEKKIVFEDELLIGPMAMIMQEQAKVAYDEISGKIKEYPLPTGAIVVPLKNPEISQLFFGAQGTGTEHLFKWPLDK